MTFEAQVPLETLSTLRTPGVASWHVEVHSLEELHEAVIEARKRTLRFVVIGGGSNILFKDRMFSGLVIKNAIRGITYEANERGVLVTAGAGEVWDEVVAEVVERGLGGLENLSGIPGTVGGTPIQNVGAYGIEVADAITWVEVFDPLTDSVRKMSPEKCRFAYRDSVFKHPEGNHLIVTRVQYQLGTQGVFSVAYRDIQDVLAEKEIKIPTLRTIRDIVLEIRGKKFPDLTHVGTAGSFFKNPIIRKDEYARVKTLFPDIPFYPVSDTEVKIPIAYVLERLGYKGMREGNVGFYQNHALVVVNYGHASAEEIISFTEKVIAHVQKEIGMTLEREVRIIE